MSDPLRDHVAAALADRYAVEAEIGRGAMAVVYRAREVRLRRVVALKVLPPELAFRSGVRERFLREAQTAAQLSHPHIVPVYSAGDDGGVAWLAMALVDGETLAERLARAPRPGIDEARRVLAETADALAYAHARGVVHRDVKPENVLLERDTGRAVVTDFGIARAAEDDGRLTGTGVTLGTPAYMSPEQAMGEAEVDGRADQYALGVVGYQLLTGALPFQATNATGMLMKHVGEAPRPVRERAPGVPPALAAAVERALAKRPADRWPDAAAFRDALLRSAGNGAAVPRPAPPFVVPTDAGPRLAMPPAMPPALPPWMPPRAPAPPAAAAPPPGADRATRDAWREYARSQRDEWREYARDQRDADRERREAWRDAARGGLAPAPLEPGLERRALGPTGLPEIPLDVRARLFRRKAVGSLVLLTFLTVVNATHFFAPPWVLFVYWGVLGGLRRRWRPLGAAGLDVWDVMAGGVDAALPAATPDEAERRLVAAARAVRGRTVGGLAALLSITVGFALSISATHDPRAAVLLVPMLLLLALTAGTLAGPRRRLRRAGVDPNRVYKRDWRDVVQRAVPRPRATVVETEFRELAARASVANGSLALLRDAVEDRVTVRETLAALSAADRALLPVDEIMPTVDGLVERVADLAGRLERFPSDASPAALAALDARLQSLSANAAAASAGPEAERTRQLLERQRTSLADLITRRAAIEAKLESARAALRNVRLDLLKLRDEGVGALAQVSTATQEARALSRDIGRALAAAAEVREV